MLVEPLLKVKVKKRRAKTNPVPTDQDRCIECGKPYAQTHEIYGGKNRQASIKYKMQVKLCQEHHTGNNGIHFNKSFRTRIQQEFQRKFEEKFNRQIFMKIFNKNYL